MIEKYDKSKHHTEAVKDLLAMTSGHPTRERLGKILNEFYEQQGHTLFIALDKGQITGIIGIDDTVSPHGWIIHLAVRPDLRMRGIGRSLIDETMETLALKSVALETDQGAVDFYRACGFEAKEIASRWPGVRRFRCVKGHQPEFVLEYYINLTLPE